jgi:hypothetical protein
VLTFSGKPVSPGDRRSYGVHMTRALVALVALALAVPAASLAQAPPTNAPPGNAAIDEYLETVPGASGDARPQQDAPNDGSGLTTTERARLEQAGTDGKLLADAVDATAPGRASDDRRRGERERPNHGTGELETAGRAPLGEVLGTVTGGDRGDGMGVALPAILLGVLLAALLLVLLRRRAAP